ncbi:MAG: S41 family peptidase [Verrucomicrobia bacterium]|nr:S41 family peptidase [Prolixibacteraceae bacterium]
MNFVYRKKGFSILLGMLIMTGGSKLNGQDVQSNLNASSVQSSALKYGRLLRIIDSYYVDTTKVEEITDKAIVEVLKNLDPHSTYISRAEVEKMNEPLQGNFEGVGISFNVYRDTLMVVTTVPGGPSEKVGIRPGDRIVSVDSKNIAGVGLQNTAVYDYLRGKKGTKVELGVRRKGESNLIDFVVLRDKIPINSLDASYMLNDHVGYIKLNKFSATTIDEFTEAIKTLKSGSKLNSLVLDLRDNGGGYLRAATELVDQFLSAFKLIVYTNGSHADKEEYISTDRGELEEGKLVLLIDEGSASASEIVAGAIQDWDRGVLIGRRSFGKGLVQQPFELTDGSMIRLTTAHYYTPTGRCIQKPYVEGVDAYQKDYLNRMEKGELFSENNVSQNTALKFATKVSQRTVYGGGGIMPDVFVRLDTSKHYTYYNNLLRKNLVYTAVLDIMDENREKFVLQYPDFKSFEANFEATDEMVNRIIEEGNKEGVTKDEESAQFARPLMKRQIKSLVARDLFSLSHYFQVMNSDDKAIVKALDVITKKGEYEKLLSGK